MTPEVNTLENDAKVLKRAIGKLMINHKSVLAGDNMIMGEVMRTIMLLNQMLPIEWQFKPTTAGWSIIKNLGKEEVH